MTEDELLTFFNAMFAWFNDLAKPNRHFTLEDTKKFFTDDIYFEINDKVQANNIHEMYLHLQHLFADKTKQIYFEKLKNSLIYHHRAVLHYSAQITLQSKRCRIDDMGIFELRDNKICHWVAVISEPNPIVAVPASAASQNHKNGQ